MMDTNWKQVHEIQRTYGIELSLDYAEWLIKGRPWDNDRCVITMHGTKSRHAVVRVERPYPLAVPDDAYELSVEHALQIHHQRIPGEGLLPPEGIAIADTDADQRIVLFAGGARVGQVWIKSWEHLEEGAPDEPERGLHFLAQSFDGFLRKLVVDE